MLFRRYFLGWLIKARRITLPGLDRVPLYDVLLLFFRSILSTQNGAITTRASAISYSLFLAIFPTLIFLFTLIPYIPINNFQVELLYLIENLIPSSIYEVVEDTITEVILQPHGDLLSISFITGIFFATNGLVSMMNAFDASTLVEEQRPWYQQRLVAIRLLFILAFMLTIAIGLMTSGQTLIKYLSDKHIITNLFTYYTLAVGKWVIIIALLFFTYSFLFYYAPSKKTRYRFISAGGTISTVLTLFVVGGFSFYINNFNQYNSLYGSIGTLLIFMLQLYLLSFALLFGFELNTSIIAARRSGRKRLIRTKSKRKLINVFQNAYRANRKSE